MKCSKCGNEFEGNFCPNCGAPASAAEKPQSEQKANWENWKPLPEHFHSEERARRSVFNKMVICRACGRQIAKTATRCPYCGAQQHKAALAAVYTIVLLIPILIILSIVSNISGGSVQSGDTAQANGTTKSDAQSAVSSALNVADGATKVDYKTLYKDYEDNAISADKKYRDKKLVLTGTIANIDRDIAQSPYITFNVDEYGAKSIKMAFDNDDTVAALKKGQKVTVVGTCNGSFASVVVVLNDCSVVK